MPQKENLLPQAINALGIKNPILDFEQKGNTSITIWFLAIGPVTWRKPAKRKQRTKGPATAPTAKAQA